ncbi:uncharacterized protein [Amphiura filiformis]|uniref:uncharacterized protein n=1 Tax=Amphiura filiformis TaxID=82378 RepID=UPI003B20FB52
MMLDDDVMDSIRDLPVFERSKSVEDTASAPTSPTSPSPTSKLKLKDRRLLNHTASAPTSPTSPSPTSKQKSKDRFLFKTPKRWFLARHFGQEGDDLGQFREANGIAPCHTGDIVITNLNLYTNSSEIYYFTNDGLYITTLLHNNDELVHPWDVAFTTQGQLVVTDQSKNVKMYDVNSNTMFSFSTLSPDEDPSTEVTTSGVAVTPMDDIIVGDSSRKVVTIHSKAGAWEPRKITVPINPVYVASNNRRSILISDWTERKVIAMNFHGETLYNIDDFKVEGHVSAPMGLACDIDCNVYIAVIKYNETTGKVIAGTGHIHQYDNKGTFIRCIAKGLYVPRGVALSNQGSLYVANETSILIYKMRSVRPLRRRCTVSIMSTQAV